MAIVDIIKKAGPKFSGDLNRDRAGYERAKENVEKLLKEVSPLEMALLDATGFNKFNLPPPGTHETEIPEEDNVEIQFSIKTHKKIKKPSYKDVCTGMQNYLDGILFLLAQGKAITGIRKEDNVPYIGVETVKDAYDIIVAGALEPSLQHKMEYIVNPPLSKEKVLSQLVIEDRNREAFTDSNFIFYVRGRRIIDADRKLIIAYEKALKKHMEPEEKEKVAQVSSTRGYQLKKAAKKVPPYTNAVKSIITVPVETHAHFKGEEIPIGEINQLLDPEFSFEDKVNMFPYYELIERPVRGKKTIFISIPSLYRGLENLLEKEPTEYNAYNITPKEIKRK